MGMNPGGLAQLARAPALQAGGHRFESDILHKILFLNQLMRRHKLCKDIGSLRK
jgi:hypothetical protein